MKYRLSLGLAAVALAAFSSNALGAESRAEPIVVIATEYLDRFSAQIRTELLALGYDVRITNDFDPGGSIEAGAAVVIRIENSKHRVEVWTVEGQERHFRTSLASDPAHGDETIAVRIGEDVRAYIAQARLPATVPGMLSASSAPADARASDRPPTSPAPALPPPAGAPSKSSVTAGGDVAVALASNDVSPSLQALAHLRWMPAQHFGAGVEVSLPILAGTLSASEGEASVRATWLSLDAYGRLTSSGSPFELGMRAGLGGVWLQMSGTAKEPYSAKRDDVFTIFPFIGAESSVAVTPHVRLRIATIVGMSSPEAKIDFAGRTAGTWGRPLAVLSFGAVTGW